MTGLCEGGNEPPSSLKTSMYIELQAISMPHYCVLIDPRVLSNSDQDLDCESCEEHENPKVRRPSRVPVRVGQYLEIRRVAPSRASYCEYQLRDIAITAAKRTSIKTERCAFIPALAS
ncbi:hypothetical protein ANN_04954 [Periplaneta americana]|uniref:Uncharacterized protein n=1 Tax=Periplaneta americana TaxID=6978 RepID=A0ABQ8TB12_PERAM|nr:hypothetical protein ANN_04954 [Periplaneta americana]